MWGTVHGDMKMINTTKSERDVFVVDLAHCQGYLVVCNIVRVASDVSIYFSEIAAYFTLSVC